MSPFINVENVIISVNSLTGKTATIQYKPVTSLAGSNNVLAHYEQSHGYDQTSHALSACTGAAVISLTPYLYTV